MRPKQILRDLRPLYVAAGAAVVIIPGSAAALAAGQADAQSAIQVSLNTRHVQYGALIKATGNASSADAGHIVELNFAPAGASSWRSLSSARVRRDGSFTLLARMKRSGLLRVVNAPASAARASSSGGVSGSQASSSPVSPSSSRPVSVAASFDVSRGTIDVAGSGRAHVRGRLLPELGNRRVTLLGHSGGSWRPIASTRTGSHGGFDLRLKPSGASHQRLRVSFAGDRQNTKSTAPAGRVVRFHQSVASYYDDAGSTACGFHAHFGVANRDLPCGTKVTFLYGGNRVTAVVDDRGPFVAGRDWDLNQNTAAALNFSGVDTVWSSL